MNINLTLLAHFFGIPFVKNASLLQKEEKINIHLIALLEHIEKSRKKNNNNFHEIDLINKEVLKSILSEQQTKQSIKILKNKYNLKIMFDLDNKVKLRIMDGSGSPFYLRKLDASYTKEIFINISNWNKGNYDIDFSDLSGTILSSGKFRINKRKEEYKVISPTDLAYLQFH